MTSDTSLELSFLNLLPPQLESSVFDLDAYFPGKMYFKMTWVEAYDDLSKQQVRELIEKGWERLDTQQRSDIFLRLSSRLCPVIAERQQSSHKQEKAVTLWIRTQDRKRVEGQPVVLVQEADKKTTKADIEHRGIGSHCLIFDQAQHAVYRYTLSDLGEVGYHFWTQIYGHLQPQQFTLSNVTSDNQFKSGAQIEETIRSLGEVMRSHYQHASQATHYLANCYWQHHTEHPGTKVRLPESISDIPALFKTKLKSGSIIPASHGLEAALLAMSNAVEGGKGWKEVKQTPMYVHEREQSQASISIRVPVPETTKDISQQLWQRVQQFSDLDGDVLLAMMAQSTTIGRDERGGTWISVEDILRYRGIVPKMHLTKDLTRRDAGHRPEDIKAIASAIIRLRNTHVTVRVLQQPRKPGGRSRKVKQESFLILISDFLTPDPAGAEQQLEVAIAWYYRPGDCLDVQNASLRKKAAWLLQQALQYDPLRQKWEKRLARYFMFQLRLGSQSFGGTTITRSIRTLITETSLPVNQTDPAKTSTRFERAMHVLKLDGHISDWSESRYQEMMQKRPARNWLETWLDCELEISAASLMEELAEDMVDRLGQPHNKEDQN